jgi:hypothetical protein
MRDPLGGFLIPNDTIRYRLSLKWRARLTWAICAVTFVGGALVVIKAGLYNSPLAVALVALPFVAATLAALFTFRCPHCGARAVKGQYGYWTVDDTCSQCLRDFEGPHLSYEEFAEQLIAEDNPDLARQLRRQRLEEEDLRKRADHDPRAAVALEHRLMERLPGVQAWVDDMRKDVSAGVAEPRHLAAAEDALKELERTLVWCRSLPRTS